MENITTNTVDTENENNVDNEITFEKLMALKAYYLKMYESGSCVQMDLLNYLYDVLDNINSEIIKQNKQRIKAKYGSTLPPGTSRNRQQQVLPVDADASTQPQTLDGDGFQPVMPRRLGGRGSLKTSIGGRGSRTGDNTGKKQGRGRLSSSSNSSYNQQYRSESDSGRPMESDSGRPMYDGGLRLKQSYKPNQSTSGGSLSKLILSGSADRVKMSINREMNKLSSGNMELIAESITDVFASWLLDELNNDKTVDDIKPKFEKYLSELWTNLIGKSLAQENMSEVYFKFLRRIMNVSSTGQTVMCCLRAKSPIMAGRLGVWQPGFYELSEYKSELLDEITTFLNQANYFECGIANTTLAKEVGGAENLANIQQAFSILGLFTKYFMDVPVGGNYRNRSSPSAWDIMLLAMYANFKLLNELLYWEPVNLAEVERRVFFTVGFLEDNRRFIQGLDTDFYRDIECQLDSIKRCASIPTSVKYKLFDCIDNFILMRKSGAGARK